MGGGWRKADPPELCVGCSIYGLLVNWEQYWDGFVELNQPAGLPWLEMEPLLELTS